MPLTVAEARDEIATKIKAVTDTVTDLVVIWDDSKKQPPAADDPAPKPWVRVQIAHVLGYPSSLVSDVGSRRFTREGLVTMQLFTPFGDGLALNDDLASQLRAALEGESSPNGAWFRRCTTREVGQSGPWFQTNVFAEFEYDEIR